MLRLRLLEFFEIEDLHAVETALRMGAVGFDAIKHLLLCRAEAPAETRSRRLPRLPRTTVAQTSAACYMCLVSWDAA